MQYSVFLNESWKEKNEIMQWIKEYNFYTGDLSDINTNYDWRFKEVVGQRRTNIFLGVADIDNFPIQYPLELKGGSYLLST